MKSTMKKLVLTALMLIGLAMSSNAQDRRNAIGLRLGDNNGFGGEVSYQRYFSDANRLEVDLGWRDSNDYDGFKLTGVYQWIFNIEGGFNWYVGVGGGLGTWDYGDHIPGPDNDDSGTFLFAAGDIGIEYNFDIPLQLSLDFRPEVYFSDGFDENFGPDIALGIRYKF
jgi:hypothetical protein